MNRPDMSKCINYGTLTKDGRFALRINSICWDCKKPTAGCRWLMDRVPYEDSIYWVQKVHWENYQDETYIIIKCPYHE